MLMIHFMIKYLIPIKLLHSIFQYYLSVFVAIIGIAVYE